MSLQLQSSLRTGGKAFFELQQRMQNLMQKTALLLKGLPAKIAKGLKQADATRIARGIKQAQGTKLGRAVKAASEKMD